MVPRSDKMIFETHAHYEGQEFDADRHELLPALFKEGIGLIIDVGSSMETTEKAFLLSKKYKRLFFAAGVHPDSVSELDDEKIEKLRDIARDRKCLAIGEIGPDFHYIDDDKLKELQLYWFRRQLDLALEEDLPVIIHSRDAAGVTLDIMKEYSKKGLRGVMHCYSYSLDQAKEYVKMGYFLGFGGAVTFKNATKKREIVKEIPMNSIVLETDCPYMAPVPVRGSRNDSSNLKYVIEKISEIKGISEKEIEERTWENAMELFSKVKGQI